MTSKHIFLPVAFAILSTASLSAQTPATTPNSHCYVAPPQDDAFKALQQQQNTRAETLYRADLAAATDETSAANANAGLVRALINQGKSREALDTASKALAQHPNNAVLLEAQGEALFRRGETDKAAQAFNASNHLCPYSPRIHLDMGRFFQFKAEYASEQRQLESAHALAPDDYGIRPRPANAHVATTEEMIQTLTDRLANPEISPDTRSALQRSINVLHAQSKGSCEVVKSLPSASIPLVPIADGTRPMYAAGIDVLLNGKRRRFELDTGASGLLLSRSSARAAGLISEAESASGGIGDQGPSKDQLTHVDDVKVGDLEYKNCLVRIVDKMDALEIDGLIGADAFSNYLVTINVPERVIKLVPLPKRPNDDAPVNLSLNTTGTDSLDDGTPRDRYVAPEMATWTKVFRSGHDLIFPTTINNGPTRLFLMDTGASYQGLISIDAAREVTTVTASDYKIKGISGDVKNVQAAERILINFGGVAQQLVSVPAVDLSNVGRNAGVEISGLIGFVTLSELVITIDYRDSLVHVVFDPKHGFHARN